MRQELAEAFRLAFRGNIFPLFAAEDLRGDEDVDFLDVLLANCFNVNCL